jgi:hypothetical protein
VSDARPIVSAPGPRPGAGTAEPRVRLLGLPLRAPATLAERRAVGWLAREGPLPLGRLLDLVAREVYRDELRHGGWAADVGVVGLLAFRAEAERAVRDAAGTLWIVGH